MNDDLISREAAVNVLEELMELDYERYIRLGHSRLTEDDWEFLINGYKEIVKTLPNVEPKTGQVTRTGKWFGTVCSACGESTSDYYNCDYCPRCGARMEVIDE